MSTLDFSVEPFDEALLATISGILTFYEQADVYDPGYDGLPVSDRVSAEYSLPVRYPLKRPVRILPGLMTAVLKNNRKISFGRFFPAAGDFRKSPKNAVSISFWCGLGRFAAKKPKWH